MRRPAIPNRTIISPVLNMSPVHHFTIIRPDPAAVCLKLSVWAGSCLGLFMHSSSSLAFAIWGTQRCIHTTFVPSHGCEAAWVAF